VAARERYRIRADVPIIDFLPVATREDRRRRWPSIAALADVIGRIPREHVAPLVAALTMTAFVVHLVFRRFAYPYDLDWLAGSVLDHIERVRNGQPLYAAPTPEWIPFMYPPLFYWLSAMTTAVVPLPIGPRVLSLACSLVQACCVWRLGRRHGATRTWAAIAVGLFVTAFGYTGFWYDMERADALFMALMMVGTLVICETASTAGAVAAGIVIGAGFLAKQPAFVFIAAGTAALTMRGETRRAAAFAVTALAIAGAAIAWLHVTTDGWFSYYVLRMPLVHGLEPEQVTQFFVHDVSRAAVLTMASGALLLGVARGSKDDAVFACMLAAGLIATASSRLHHGAWNNVLLFWSSFAVAAVAVTGSRADAALPHNFLARAGVGAFVTLQFGLWCFGPHAMHPPRHMRALTERFDERVRALEASSGEVLLIGRGHVTVPRHFHLAALADVLKADGRLPADVARALTGHRFGAIIAGDSSELRLLDTPEVDQQLYRSIVASYYVAEAFDPLPLPVVQFAWQPMFILRPRDRNLDAGDVRLLDRHHHLEVVLALSRLRARQMGIAAPEGEPSVEGLVQSMLAQATAGDIVLR
jgi:hypothetical protein